MGGVCCDGSDLPDTALCPVYFLRCNIFSGMGLFRSRIGVAKALAPAAYAGIALRRVLPCQRCFAVSRFPVGVALRGLRSRWTNAPVGLVRAVHTPGVVCVIDGVELTVILANSVYGLY